jgi:hypothetical protein
VKGLGRKRVLMREYGLIKRLVVDGSGGERSNGKKQRTKRTYSAAKAK